MKNILIDTNILIDFLRGKEKAREFLLSVAEESTLYCSVITVAEIYAGMREEEKEKTDDLLDSLNIVEINRAVAEKAGEYKYQIRRQHLELDDCMIAASAFYVKTLLVTGNGKHYPMPDIEKIVISTD
jgi:predicted nucleic acid-binding protein